MSADYSKKDFANLWLLIKSPTEDCLYQCCVTIFNENKFGVSYNTNPQKAGHPHVLVITGQTNVITYLMNRLQINLVPGSQYNIIINNTNEIDPYTFLYYSHHNSDDFNTKSVSDELEKVLSLLQAMLVL